MILIILMYCFSPSKGAREGHTSSIQCKLYVAVKYTFIVSERKTEAYRLCTCSLSIASECSKFVVGYLLYLHHTYFGFLSFSVYGDMCRC
jgi:hypothetical protein